MNDGLVVGRRKEPILDYILKIDIIQYSRSKGYPNYLLNGMKNLIT